MFRVGKNNEGVAVFLAHRRKSIIKISGGAPSHHWNDRHSEVLLPRVCLLDHRFVICTGSHQNSDAFGVGAATCRSSKALGG